MFHNELNLPSHALAPNVQEITIREATLEDGPRLAELISQLSYPTSAEEFAIRFGNIVSDSTYKTFVAETKDGVVGMLGLRLGWQYGTDGRIIQIIAMVVDGKCRKQGIGALLVKKALELARSYRATSLNLTSALASGEAHVFYEGQGFKKTGLRMAYDFECESEKRDQ